MEQLLAVQKAESDIFAELEPGKSYSEVTFNGFEGENLPLDKASGMMVKHAVREWSPKQRTVETRMTFETTPRLVRPDVMAIKLVYVYDDNIERSGYQRDYIKGWPTSISFDFMLNEPKTFGGEPEMFSIPLSIEPQSSLALVIREYERRRGSGGDTRMRQKDPSEYDDRSGGLMGFMRARADHFKDTGYNSATSQADIAMEDAAMANDSAIDTVAKAAISALASISLRLNSSIERADVNYGNNAELIPLINQSNPLYMGEESSEPGHINNLTPANVIFAAMAGPWVESISALSAQIKDGQASVDEQGFYLYPANASQLDLSYRRNSFESGRRQSPSSVGHELAMKLSAEIDHVFFRPLDANYWANFIDASYEVTDLWDAGGKENPFGRVVISFLEYRKKHDLVRGDHHNWTVANFLRGYKYMDYLSPFTTLLMLQKVADNLRLDNPFARQAALHEHVVPLLNGIRALQLRYSRVDERQMPKVEPSGNNQLVKDILKRSAAFPGKMFTYIAEICQIDRTYANQIIDFVASKHTGSDQ